MTHADARSYRLPGLFLTVRRVSSRAWSLTFPRGGVVLRLGAWRVVRVRT